MQKKYIIQATKNVIKARVKKIFEWIHYFGI